MKKVLALVSMLFVFISSITSCRYAGDDDATKASKDYNFVGELKTKSPTDFDRKFGYEVVVFDTITLKESVIKTVVNKVFISEVMYKNIPDPADSIKILIHWIGSIEYGRSATGRQKNSNEPGVFEFMNLWDKPFNIGVYFEVMKNKK